MKPLVTQVWPQFTADQQFCAAFGSVLVERVELYRTKRKVIICLRSAEPLDDALCGRLCASLAAVFAGYELHLRNYFAYPNITPQAVCRLIEELKEQGMPVNGFLDKNEPVSFGADGITIHVNAGRTILESVELPRVLAELIQERTGSLPIVRLADTGRARSEQEFEEYLQKKAPVVKFEARETPPDFTIEGLCHRGQGQPPQNLLYLHHRLFGLCQPQSPGGRRRRYVQVGESQARHDADRARQLPVRQIRA